MPEIELPEPLYRLLREEASRRRVPPEMLLTQILLDTLEAVGSSDDPGTHPVILLAKAVEAGFDNRAWYSPAEIAGRLRVDERVVQDWVESEDLPLKEGEATGEAVLKVIAQIVERDRLRGEADRGRGTLRRPGP